MEAIADQVRSLEPDEVVDATLTILRCAAPQTKWSFKQSKPPKGAIIQKGPW